jgi:transposase-like protein
MYSREMRMKAIELYIKYDKSAAAVIHELGYPSRKLLPRWYKAYIQEKETGIVNDRYIRRPKYSSEQKAAAIKHYLEHGRSISRTIRSLGYPNRETLREWCKDLVPGTRKRRSGGIQYTQEQKEECVIALCSRPGNAEDVAKEYGVTRAALYIWKNNLIGKGGSTTVARKKDETLPNDKEFLSSEIESLKRQILKLKLEKDILEGTVEIIKKDPGVDPKSLSNKEKWILIDTLRNKYSLKDLLALVGMARSSYFYHSRLASASDKYESIRLRIIELFNENSGRYGYRRIHALLAKEEFRISEKVVRRIMAEGKLAVISKKRRKYSSYQGEDTPAAPNLISRDFRADSPNVKWLTDLTEFHIPAGKVYLSPIVDCFDGLLISWTIGTNPDAELVNSMLDIATATLKPNDHPIVHSDRGVHYRWPGWIDRMNKAGLTRSMCSGIVKL